MYIYLCLYDNKKWAFGGLERWCCNNFKVIAGSRKTFHCPLQQHQRTPVKATYLTQYSHRCTCVCKTYIPTYVCTYNMWAMNIWRPTNLWRNRRYIHTCIPTYIRLQVHMFEWFNKWTELEIEPLIALVH